MKPIKALPSIAIIAALGVTAALAYHHSKPKKIDVTRNVVVYTEDDPSSTFTTQIHISGTLHRPLFRQHKFSGSITIDAFEFTRTYWTWLGISMKKNGIYMGGLMYSIPESYEFKTAGSATIWFDEKFEWINIWTTPSWRQKNAPEPDMFIATGETYEQAIANQKAMKEKWGNETWFMPEEFPGPSFIQVIQAQMAAAQIDCKTVLARKART